MVNLIDAAAKLSPLGMALAAIISGALGWWGFTWSHKAQLEEKDRTIEEVRKQVVSAQADRDYWRDQAVKGAEVNAKWADRMEQTTDILESVTTKAVATK